MSTTELEPKEKRQRVQSEDDSVPASTITSPLCMCSAQSVNTHTCLLHTCRNEVIVYRRMCGGSSTKKRCELGVFKLLFFALLDINGK